MARDRRWVGHVVVCALYLALAVGFFWKVCAHPATVVQNGGDEFNTILFLEWMPWAILHGHNPLSGTVLNWPYGFNLLDQTSDPILAVLLAPVTLLFGPIASFNVGETLSLAASAFAAYAFVLPHVKWRPSAFAGGLLFGFGPYQFAQVSHLNLTFVPGVPLILLVAWDIVVRQRWRARRAGVGLGLLLIAQFLISPEILIDTAVVGATVAFAIVVAGRRSIAHKWRHVAESFVWAGGIAIVVLAYPVWYMLRGPAHIEGPIQLVPQAYRADFASPVVPTNRMWIAPAHWARVAAGFSNSPTENGSYLGVVLLGVLAVATIALWRNSEVKAVVRSCVLGGTVAFVLSLGAGLVIKDPPKASYSGFPLPERLLADLPLTSNVIPARFDLLSLLFAALFLAVVLDRLHVGLGSGVRSALVPVAVSVLCMVPLIPSPIEGFARVDVPAVFTSGSPAVTGAIVLYPYPSGNFPQPVLWQAMARLSFSQPGGTLLVPGANGRIAFDPATGYTRPNPVSITLIGMENGNPPDQSPDIRARVLDQLRSWHVRELIEIPSSAPFASSAQAFFTWLFGSAPSTAPGGALIWRVPGA